MLSGRVIKFRAWFSEAQTMLYNITLLDAYESGMSEVEHGTSRYNNETQSGVAWNIKDGTLMQFTGLKDCNGKEIYEGDILEYKVYQTEIWDRNDSLKIDTFIMIVESILDIKQQTRGLISYKVIGNIFQNPDLIP